MACVLFIAAKDDLYGASRALLAHVRRLGAHGISPVVLTPGGGALSDAVRGSALPLLVAPVVASARSIRSRLLAPFALRSVTREARARAVALVVAATLSAAPSARRLARALGVPWVLHLRSTYVERGMASALVRYGAEQADAIVAVSEVVASEYRAVASVSAKAPCVVFDGIEPIDPMSRGEARARLGLPSDGVVAGILGAITPRKATGFAARVAAQAGVTLGVLGDGGGAELEAVNAAGSARLFGFQKDATRLLPAFDVLLHPARQEAFGLAPLEAMACGVPVLASDVEGLREVAGGGAAMLLDPAREADWVLALRRVLDVSALRAELVANGLERSRRLTADVSAARVADIYRTTIREGWRA